MPKKPACYCTLHVLALISVFSQHYYFFTFHVRACEPIFFRLRAGKNCMAFFFYQIPYNIAYTVYTYRADIYYVVFVLALSSLYTYICVHLFIRWIETKIFCVSLSAAEKIHIVLCCCFCCCPHCNVPHTQTSEAHLFVYKRFCEKYFVFVWVLRVYTKLYVVQCMCLSDSRWLYFWNVILFVIFFSVELV